jgi:hypothetical protein
MDGGWWTLQNYKRRMVRFQKKSANGVKTGLIIKILALSERPCHPDRRALFFQNPIFSSPEPGKLLQGCFSYIGTGECPAALFEQSFYLLYEIKSI